MSIGKDKTPFALLSARASFWAPMAALALNLVAGRIENIGTATTMNVVAMALVIVGLILAIIALLGVRKHGRETLLGLAIIGLVFNLLVLGTQLFASVRQQQQSSQPPPPLVIRIPAGFAAVPMDQPHASIVSAHVKGNPSDQLPDLYIIIERLGGTLNRESHFPMFQERFPESTMFKQKWKEHDIEVFRTVQRVDDFPLVSLYAPVPILPEAIQIKLMGLVENEKELKEHLKSMLESIDSPTNW